MSFSDIWVISMHVCYSFIEISVWDGSSDPVVCDLAYEGLNSGSDMYMLGD